MRIELWIFFITIAILYDTYHNNMYSKKIYYYKENFFKSRYGNCTADAGGILLPTQEPIVKRNKYAKKDDKKGGSGTKGLPRD